MVQDRLAALDLTKCESKSLLISSVSFDMTKETYYIKRDLPYIKRYPLCSDTMYLKRPTATSAHLPMAQAVHPAYTSMSHTLSGTPLSGAV